MSHRYTGILFTPAVQAMQARQGSRGAYERLQEPDAPARDRLGPAEQAWIGRRDSFYLATVSASGWPYVQHRGGPPGFLKVLDERTLAFADYAGNRQYISVGNLETEDRVSLFLMDYANRRRLKLLGRAHTADLGQEPDLAARLRDGENGARVERAVVIAVAGFDWNCPQHITPRYTPQEWAALAPPP